MMFPPPGREYGLRHVVSPTGENPPEYRDLLLPSQRKIRK